MQTTLSSFEQIVEEMTLSQFLQIETKTPDASDEIYQEITEEIEQKREQIRKLKKEIEDAEAKLLEVEAEEADIDPEEGDEDIFDALAPQLEEDLREDRYETEAEIRVLECEIGELEARMKHAR